MLLRDTLQTLCHDAFQNSRALVPSSIRVSYPPHVPWGEEDHWIAPASEVVAYLREKTKEFQEKLMKKQIASLTSEVHELKQQNSQILKQNAEILALLKN